MTHQPSGHSQSTVSSRGRSRGGERFRKASVIRAIFRCVHSRIAWLPHLARNESGVNICATDQRRPEHGPRVVLGDLVVVALEPNETREKRGIISRMRCSSCA